MNPEFASSLGVARLPVISLKVVASGKRQQASPVSSCQKSTESNLSATRAVK